MPKLLRSDLIGMSYGNYPGPLGLAKVRVPGRFRKEPRSREILVWSSLTGPDSLRREVKKTLKTELLWSTACLDAGHLTVDRKGRIQITGHPDEVLDVPILTSEGFLTMERQRTQFLIETIAGRSMPVSTRK